MAFKPFPPGTVRGPYTCGIGNNPSGGVQFMVQTGNGWVPFIEPFNQEAKCRGRAEEFAKKTLEHTTRKAELELALNAAGYRVHYDYPGEGFTLSYLSDHTEQLIAEPKELDAQLIALELEQLTTGDTLRP